MESVGLAVLVLAVISALVYSFYKASEEEHAKEVRVPREIPDDFVSARCASQLKKHGVDTFEKLRHLKKDDLLVIPHIGDQRANAALEKIRGMSEEEMYRYYNILGEQDGTFIAK